MQSVVQRENGIWNPLAYIRVLSIVALLCAFAPRAGAQFSYVQLESIEDIDPGALYVLGNDLIGFHCAGTSNWGTVALPSEQSPILYTLTKAADGSSFTAQATISGVTFYLQIRYSNTFKMDTLPGEYTDLVIGTTAVSENNNAVTNKNNLQRHLRINGDMGLRSYQNQTGSMAYFYKVVQNGGGPAAYSVSFNAVGGEFVGNSDFPNTTNSKLAGTYSLPSATMEGHTFNGWTTAGSSTLYNGSYTVSGDIDFMAYFTDNGEPASPPTIVANDVVVPYTATSVAIPFYVEDQPDPVGSVSAEITSGGDRFALASGNPQSSPVTLSCAANTTIDARSATVRLTYTYAGGRTVTRDITVTHEQKRAFTGVGSEGWLNARIYDNTHYIRLDADIVLNELLKVGHDIARNVILDLNGHTLSRNLNAVAGDGHVIEVFAGSTLTIIDGVGGGTISGGRANNGGGICNYGILNFWGGTITGCYAEVQGGGIKNNSGATVNMSGGAIMGCWGRDCGGIFNAEGGTLNITGGTISGNTSNAGGGGVVNYGTATIIGGTIHNNHATTRGGGIWTLGPMTLGAATIVGNRADIEGGGVYVKQGGNASLYSTAIRDNTSADAGGIYVDASSTVGIAHISITGNTSTAHGGGGISNHGTLNVNGSTVQDNRCLTNGAGIWNGGFVNMEGTVTISDNHKLNGWTSNLYCCNDQLVTVVGSLGSSTIYVSHESNDGYITTGYQANNTVTNHFCNDVPEACNLTLVGGEAKLTPRTDVVYYVERSWDGEKVVETLRTVPSSSTMVLSGIFLSDVEAAAGTWLVVKDYIVLRDNIQVRSGTVNLILCDGSKLSACPHLISGATMNIYSQLDDNGTLYSPIIVHGGARLNIHGGIITSEGSEHYPGIGGGLSDNTGTIAIYGGSVTARGGAGGAGIGSPFINGNAHSAEEVNFTGSDIQIYGGTVYAYGGTSWSQFSGAGIGGGGGCGGGTITIRGGYVVAVGGEDAAGIGSGEEWAYNIDGGTITISGGEVYAYGDDAGAGIGAGQDAALGTINLVGGYIEAEGGENSNAISSHDNTDGDNIRNIGNHMKLEAGDNSSGATPVEATSRLQGLSRKFVRLQPCQHTEATYTGSEATFAPHAACTYCMAPLFNVGSSCWHAITAPTSEYGKTTLSPTDITGLTVGSYDLFRYNEATATWENWKEHGFDFERGRGYIYRRGNNAVVGFNGYMNAGNISLGATFSCTDNSLKGFSLIGNPYSHSISRSNIGGSLAAGYYTLQPDGCWHAETSAEIAPGQAIMVQTTATGNITFTESTGKSGNPLATLRFALSDGEYSDVAFAMIGAMPQDTPLRKMAHLNQQAPLLFIPGNDANYAIAALADGVKQFPLSLSATPGLYTIEAAVPQGTIGYCHLIDKDLQLDIDLLREGSYRFQTSGDDYDRFLVRLSPGGDEQGLSLFAWREGDRIVVHGEGTLQLFDIMGRQILAREVSGSCLIQCSPLPAGVYLLHLGDKCQKIVITK